MLASSSRAPSVSILARLTLALPYRRAEWLEGSGQWPVARQEAGEGLLEPDLPPGATDLGPCPTELSRSTASTNKAFAVVVQELKAGLAADKSVNSLPSPHHSCHLFRRELDVGVLPVRTEVSKAGLLAQCTYGSV